jgi:hypothetical protein
MPPLFTHKGWFSKSVGENVVLVGPVANWSTKVWIKVHLKPMARFDLRRILIRIHKHNPISPGA